MVGYQGTRFVGFAPGSYNATSRTVEAVLSAGTAVQRLYFTEELEISDGAIDLSRAEAGLVCLLDTHNQFEVGAVLGTVSNVRITNGQLVGRLAFGATDRAREVEGMVARGELRGVSIGYKVNTWDIRKTDNDGRETWRAVRWELLEVSLVSVPADANAGVRSALGTSPGVTPEEEEMLTRNNPGGSAAPAAPAPPAPPAPGQRASITALRDLTTMAANDYDLPRDQCAELALEMAERGFTDVEARAHVMEILATRQRNSTAGITTAGALLMGGGGRTLDNPNFYGRAIQDALYSRMSGRAPSDAAREFMGMSLVQLATDLSSRAGVRDVTRMSPEQIIAAASWNRGVSRPDSIQGYAVRMGAPHTTSDFGDLLVAAGERYLMDVFAAAGSPLKMVSHERSARDFREISGLQLSGFGKLLEAPEGAEVKYGSFKSRKETYRVKAFSKMFGLSIQAIINDDLGAFSNPIRLMGRAAAETEAAIFADLINNNLVLGDGVALFHATHGNLAGAGAAPDVTTLGAGRLAMRSQKDLDGVTPLATGPKYIIASPKRETEIEQLLVATTVPTNADDANPFQGKLLPAIDPRLDENPWYLFADPQLAPVLEHAYLDGYQGPRIRMREGWDVLGQEFRADMFFGAGVVDHRGAYKNPGA